jgi:hypothetical protein
MRSLSFRGYQNNQGACYHRSLASVAHDVKSRGDSVTGHSISNEYRHCSDIYHQCSRDLSCDGYSNVGPDDEFPYACTRAERHAKPGPLTDSVC